ncbi:MAG TPA: hypothetical protein VFQ70_01520 [Candidatus Saccharimonadaceae bacterium]|nr:hypothetical protein [Candidatus Saccharimonadaceae bacterium]
MEFLKQPRRRSLLSEGLYLLLNIILVVVVLVSIIVVQSPLPGIVLVLLSKWRVLAVRPRYWMAHVQTNIVDTVVGLSFALLIYEAIGSLGLQIALTILYAIWQLWLKPKSTRGYMAVQAGVSVFLGVSALYAVAYNWPSSLVVIVMWVIAYAAARHVLGSFEEAHRSFFSMAWGFVMAEFGWLFYHWTFTYSFGGSGGVKIAQVAIVVTVIHFVAYKVYASIYHNKHLRLNDVLLPILLSGSVVLVLLVFFNTIPITGS